MNHSYLAKKVVMVVRTLYDGSTSSMRLDNNLTDIWWRWICCLVLISLCMYQLNRRTSTLSDSVF